MKICVYHLVLNWTHSWVHLPKPNPSVTMVTRVKSFFMGILQHLREAIAHCIHNQTDTNVCAHTLMYTHIIPYTHLSTLHVLVPFLPPLFSSPHPLDLPLLFLLLKNTPHPLATQLLPVSFSSSASCHIRPTHTEMQHLINLSIMKPLVGGGFLSVVALHLRITW